MEDSLESKIVPPLDSDEADQRRPLSVGIVLSRVDHLSNETFLLKVTLNEFHRWDIVLDPDLQDNKSERSTLFTSRLRLVCILSQDTHFLKLSGGDKAGSWFCIEQAKLELPSLPHGTHYLTVACLWPGFVSATGL